MPIGVVVKGVGKRLFPDDMAPDQIREVLQSKFPMDTASRMQRAKEQGFSDQTYYRGVVGATDDSKNPAITWATTDPDYANQYAFKDMKSGENVMPLKVKAERPYDLGFRSTMTQVKFEDMLDRVDLAVSDAFNREQIGEKEAIKLMNEIDSLKESGEKGFKKVHEWWQQRPEIKDLLQRSGYDSIKTKEGFDDRVPTIGVFEPSQIRSVNATFDPVKRDSANLLAGSGALAVGAGALGSDDAEAGVAGKVAGKLFKISAGGADHKIDDAGRLFRYNKNRDQWIDLTGTPAEQNILTNKRRIDEAGGMEAFEAEAEGRAKRMRESIDAARVVQDESYKMQHQAPTLSDGSGVSGVDIDNAMPDIYKGNAGQLYGTGLAYDQKALNVIRGMKGKPEKEVTIYRSVPKEVTEINPGDWVATTREYARDHIGTEKGWHILSKKVKAKDIATDGNSIHEWGYSPESAIASVKGRVNQFALPTTGAMLAAGAALPENARADSKGTIQGANVPELQQAADILEKLELPVIGKPFQGLADWARGAAYNDKDKLKRALVAALDLI